MPDPSLTAVCQLFAPRERFVEEEKQIIQQRRKIATALGRQRARLGRREQAGRALKSGVRGTGGRFGRRPAVGDGRLRTGKLVGYLRMVPEKRHLAARWIAWAIALGGLPWAIDVARLTCSCGVFGGLLLFIDFSGGWFGYFVLFWTAAGRWLPVAPYTTWLPCIIVHGFWVALLMPAVTFSPITFWEIYSWAFPLAGLVGAVIALLIELRKNSARTR
jgi:hypothetical protein